MSDEQQYEEVDEVELCRNNFLAYCIAQYPAFSFPKHILVIASYLEKVARGEIKRLMIFAPPRHGKSEIVSKLFPGYYIGHHKGKRTVAVATYGQDLSNEIGIALQQRMNSETYREIFPEATPSDSANAIKRMVTINGGGYLTIGIGGALTGKGAHLRILDDPNKNREEAESDLEQQKQWDWWTSVFATRGEQEIRETGPTADEDESPIVIILTRWSDKDIAKRLMDKQKEEEAAGITNGDKWTILNLPAIAESKDDPLGRPVPSDVDDASTWSDANALWPQKFSARKLAALKVAVGPRDWNSLYQQRPSSAKGDIYIRDRWGVYQEVPKECDKPVQSWDCNYRDTDGSDFACGFVARVRKKTSVYIMDRWKGRWSLAVLCAKVKEAKTLYPDTTAIYIERKANGEAVIQTVSKDIPGVVAVDPESLGSKIARNEAAAKYQNAGNIYLPLNAPWVDDFIEQLAAWPNGKNDDDADAFAQLVLMELGMPSTDALIRAIEKELIASGVDIDKLDVGPNDPYSVYYMESKGDSIEASAESALSLFKVN